MINKEVVEHSSSRLDTNSSQDGLRTTTEPKAYLLSI